MPSRYSRFYRPRARLACSACHRRKVRCDATVRGAPCTNCLDSGDLCVVRRTVKHQTISRTSSTCHGHDSAGRNSEPTGTSVLYVYYPFLVAKRLHCIEAADLAYLEAKGGLHIPSGHILETFVRHYFLHVHPCLPLVNEAEFWRVYRGKDASRSISLLLFKAMLFAASCFIPFNVIRQCGFQSSISARDQLYRSAQLLYDFKIESDHIAIAQAALLLSHYSSSEDQRSNTAWLAIAIQSARFEHAHEYDHRSVMDCTEKKRSELKRLWWCCCLRDRNLAIGTRRPLQITSDNFDLSQACLSMQDLEEELNYSEVYNPGVKAALCGIVVNLCSLAVVLTNLVMAIYPARGFDSLPLDSKDNILDKLHKLDEAKQLLIRWKQSSVISAEVLPANIHSSVSLYIVFTSLWYHSARIALCHQVGFLLNTCSHEVEDEEMKRLEVCSHELAESVDSIAEKMKRLKVTGLAQYLPINAVPYTMLPQILTSLNIRLSSTPIEKKRHSKTLGYFTEVSRLYQDRFDTTHVARYIEEVLGRFECDRLSDDKCHDVTACDIFFKQPGTYLHLPLLLDNLLSRGNSVGGTGLLPYPTDAISLPLQTLGEARSSGEVVEIQEAPYPPLALPMGDISAFSDLCSNYLSLGSMESVDLGNTELGGNMEAIDVNSNQFRASDESAAVDGILGYIALFGE